MSWYTDYRPATIKELHLESVRQKFEAYMKKGSFPQVFLFAGPKGTGKTSAARILGAMLNDLKNEVVVRRNFYDKNLKSFELKASSIASKTSTGNSQASSNALKVSSDSNIYQEPDVNSPSNQSIITGKSFVVQEMDAASNRGIEDVRNLKDRAQLPPQDGLMSVFILDEAHMLTTDAFNALLKLLEEPPPHAVFVLATTERHKVPETVLSRTAEIAFRSATISELISALKAVLKKVNLSADPLVLEKIAHQASGSFRDAVKLLELVATTSEKTHLSIEHINQSQFGIIDDQAVIDLLQAVMQKQAPEVAKTIAGYREQGLDANNFYKRVLRVLHCSLHQALRIAEGEAPFNHQVSLFFLDELQNLQTHSELIPFLQLELILLKIIDRASTRSGTNQPDSKQSSSNSTDPKPKIKIKKSDSIQAVDHVDSSQLLNDWESFLNAVQAKNSTIAALLRSSKPIPEKSNGVAMVQVFYQFHKDQLSQPKFLKLLQECAYDLTGQKISFDFEIDNSLSVAEEALM
jgi:DNA polymerase III subunit gamma/tau